MTTPTDKTAKPGARPAADETRLPILGLIAGVEQVSRAGTPPETFLRELVRSATALSGAVYGSFWAVNAKTGQVGPAVELMPQVSEAAARAWGKPLAELAQGALEQSIIRYAVVSEPADRLLTGERYLAVGFPVRGEERIAGCLILVVTQSNAILSDAGVALLQLLVSFGLLYGSAQAAARYERFYQSLSGAWDLMGETLAFRRSAEMAQVLANRARAALGAERVSVGFVRRGRARVTAISGEDTVDRRSNVARLIQAAQTEVLVSGEPAEYARPAAAGQDLDQRARYPQQEHLAETAGAHAVYTVPLRKDREVVAAWTFEFGEGRFTPEVRQVIDVTAGHLGPVLQLAVLNDRSFLRRAADRTAEGVRWLVGREHPWRKVGLAAAVTLVALAVFLKWEFTVAGSCTLTPSFRRVYSAPFESTIKEAPVRPGDPVAEGQPIVFLDREQLDHKLREAKSKRVSAEKEMSTYFAQEKMSQYAEAKARFDALSAEIAILEQNLARATITSDVAGIVLVGDLRKDIGRPVRMGEPLIEISPLNELLLEIEVEQGDVAYVEPGQSGRFTVKARPTRPIPFTVRKVRPTPEPKSGGSYYIAEAVVANDDGQLRPGMEGAARVSIDRRNVTWVVTRKLLNWLRMRLWW